MTPRERAARLLAATIARSGKSYQEIAEAVELHPSTIGKACSGDCVLPVGRTRAVARVLGLDAAQTIELIAWHVQAKVGGPMSLFAGVDHEETVAVVVLVENLRANRGEPAACVKCNAGIGQAHGAVCLKGATE